MPLFPALRELMVYKEEKSIWKKITPKYDDTSQPFQAQEVMTTCFTIIYSLWEVNLCLLGKDKLSAL